MSDKFPGKPVIADNITTRFIDDEAVVMDLVSLKTYYLNETASLVWSHIGKATSFDGIVDELVESFDISQDECRDEVAGLLKSWASEKLIRYIEK